LLVISVIRTSCRRRVISSSHSPERFGSCFIPMSSRINRSGFRYRAKILSCPAYASSCNSSRTTSTIGRGKSVSTL
jgi:hypothetical protein